jgi:exoribonuclease R
VRAEIKRYNGKDEAIVVEILWETWEVLEGVYSDNDKFGFVKVEGSKDDIFIPWSKKMQAVTWERVKVRILKQWGRRREGIIEEIL